MAIFTNANLQASIPKIWTNIINEALFPQFVLQAFVMDLSSYADEGDIFHVPNLYTNIFSATNVSSSGTDFLAAGTVQNPAQVDVYLTINTTLAVSWLIGRQDAAQLKKSYDLMQKYAMEAARVLLQGLEDNLFGLLSSLSTTPIAPASITTTTPIDDLSVRRAIGVMQNANFPAEDLAVFMNTLAYWNQFAGLAKISANYSSNLNLIKSGGLGGDGKMMGTDQAKGVVYGLPVMLSPRVPTVTLAGGAIVYNNVVLSKSALGFAIQNGNFGDYYEGDEEEEMMDKVSVDVWFEKRLQSLAAVLYMRFGTQVLRNDAGQVFQCGRDGQVA